jgi:hypothetical protein
MIHVLVPFSRWYYKDILINHLSKFPVDVTLLQTPVESGDPPYVKLNEFIKYGPTIIDDDYYCVLNDDDHYQSGVFDNLPDADVIFISMKLGDNEVKGSAIGIIPPVLIASPDNIHPTGVGLEQYIVKGRVLRQMQFRTDVFFADGLMAEWLKYNFNCAYEPDRYVLFNYLEPGRWDEVEFILKEAIK